MKSDADVAVELPQAPMAQVFNLDQLLNTAEFDHLLSEIEQDLERQAQGKGGTIENDDESGSSSNDTSELGEVLAFLNKVATEQPLTRQPTAVVTPSTQTVDDAAEESPEELEDIKPLFVPNPVVTPVPPTNTSTTASTQKSETSSPSLPKIHPNQESSRGGRGGGRSSGAGLGLGYGGRGRGGAGKGAVPSQRSSDKDTNTTPSDSDSDSDSGSDNDDDWRSMRHKLKAAERSIADTTETERLAQPVWTGRKGQTLPEVVDVEKTPFIPGKEDSDSDDEDEDEDEFDDGDDDSHVEEHHVEISTAVKINIDSGSDSDSDDEKVIDVLDDVASKDTCVGMEDILPSPPSIPPSIPSVFISESADLESVTPPCVPTIEVVGQQVDVAATSSASAGGILGGAGRDRSRKGRGKLGVSKVDAARKRREEKLVQAAREKELEVERQRLALIEEEVRLKAAVVQKQIEDDEEKAKAIEESGGNDSESLPQEDSILFPHDVFPPPGECEYCPCLAPSLASAFEHAYDTPGVVSKEVLSVSNNMVVVQCEIPSVAASSSCFQTDEWVYTLLTWLIDKQSEIEASIIGTTLTNGSTDFLADGTTRSLYVVMEGFVPTPNQFLGGNIKQLLQSVSLSTVLPALTSFGESAFLSEVMRVLTPEESVSAVHNIVAMPFSDGADSGKSIVSGVNWMQRLNQNSVTTCVFKDYFLSATTPMYTLNMKKIFATIEQSGLRLCGLRTAYVPAETHRIKKSPTSVISKYVHGSILTQPFSSSSREDCHLVLVACFFTPRFVASEQLRNLLGPEDVALARRTDPSSIRALYSNIDEKKLDRALRNNVVSDGIVRNVAFPMAIQATNCWKETLFWFGPRYVPSGTPAPVSASGNMCQSTLMIPSERVVVLGVAIECTDSDFLSMEKDAVYQKASIVSNELSCLQRDALKSIQGLTASTMKVITFWSTNAEEYQKYGLTCQGDSIGPHPLACYLVFLLQTTSSDVHLEQVTGAIAETSARISSHAEHWRATMSLKVRKSFKRYSKPSLLQDVKSQIAQAETASKLDSHDYDNKPQHLEDEDFDSHEDVGLQDVVVIAIPLVLGDDSWGTAKKDVNFGPLIPPQELVLHLMAALPVVSYTTILGVFTSLDDVSDIINPSESTAIMSSTTAAKRVYLCLRGFHLVETIGDALQQSIENISVAASMGGGLLPNIAFDARAKLLRIPKVTDFKVLKGKKALDIVGKCFLNIEPRGQHLSLTEQTNFMDFFAQCDSHNFIPQCTLKSQISPSVQALFPPGRFTSLSVVVVPYPRDKTSKGVPTHSNGLFIKVFKKLEKAGFDIMSVATKVVDQSMAKYCQEHVELSQASYGSSSYGTHTKEWFDALVGHTVLCVVVAGNSALLRLQPVIGPFDTSVAQENYPLSISASLHQPATSTTKASHLDCHSIRIFQSTTVDATDAMMKMLSNHSYSTADLLQAAQSQEKQMSTKISSMRPVANLLSDFGSMECHTYQQRYESTSNRQVSVSSLGSSGGVEPAVFEGLRQNSLKEHNAWMAREKEATHTISK